MLSGESADGNSASVLLPVFKLINAVRDYARDAVADSSPAALASNAVQAAASGLMSGFWESAANAKSQAATRLAGSQANIQTQVEASNVE